MKPARSHPRIRLFLFGLIVGLIYFLFFATKIFNGEKLVLATYAPKGDVTLSLFDPGQAEIVNIVIPGTTLVDVARGLGNFQIKNVWQLGKDNSLGGILIAQTILKNFKIPVNGWGEAPQEVLGTGRGLAVFRAVFSKYNTNLTLADKVRLAIFSLGIGERKRLEVDLAGLAVIKKATLPDGTLGFVITGRTPEEVSSFFIDRAFSEDGIKIAIHDRTEKGRVADKVGEILEALGGKIASIFREGSEDSDCRVVGAKKRLVNKVGDLFSCKKVIAQPQGNFDLEIFLGNKFAGRF